MALSRLWYEDVNVAASDVSTAALLAKSLLWGWKALLRGQITGTNGVNGAPPAGSRWTCEGSSDSATAGMDAVDRWGATFDATKLVRNTAGNAHSWIVLKSPAAMGPLYLLLDWSTGGDNTITIKASNAAFTGGSTTAAPTSTKSWGYDARPFNDGSSTVGHKLHRVTDADGNFWFFTRRNSSGIFHFLFGFTNLIDTRPNELCPAFTFCHYRSGDRGAGHMHAIDTNTFDALYNGSYGEQTRIVGGRYFNDTGVDANLVAAVLGYTHTGAGSRPLVVALTQANANDSKWDGQPGPFVASGTGSFMGVRGHPPDVLVVGSAVIGGSLPSAAAMERVVVGNLALPCSVPPAD